jgi:hypothetical protein
MRAVAGSGAKPLEFKRDFDSQPAQKGLRPAKIDRLLTHGSPRCNAAKKPKKQRPQPGFRTAGRDACQTIAGNPINEKNDVLNISY